MKEFEKPTMELLEFLDDVIATSGGGCIPVCYTFY